MTYTYVVEYFDGIRSKQADIVADIGNRNPDEYFINITMHMGKGVHCSTPDIGLPTSGRKMWVPYHAITSITRETK